MGTGARSDAMSSPLGRVPIRRLKAEQIDGLYERLLNPTGDKRPLSPKSVMEVQQVIRSALRESERLGIVSRNVALAAHAPRARGVPRPERKAWTADELQRFLQAAVGHRLFPVFWLIANTGMRRNEVLGHVSATPTRHTRWPPTNMSYPGCKQTPPPHSNRSSAPMNEGHRSDESPGEGGGRDGRSPVEESPWTVEALANSA